MAEIITTEAERPSGSVAEERGRELCEALKASRKRCAFAGLDPSAKVLPPVTRGDIEIARKNVLGGIAYTRKTHLGYLRSLDSLVASYGGAIFYLDHSLRICGLGGDEDLLAALKDRNIKFGASFSEEQAGTNAASLTRELLCGCYLKPRESYCEAFGEFACFSQGPIKIGIDDFIIAFVMVPPHQLSKRDVTALKHALLTLGIISLRNERPHAYASSSLLDILMARRGLGYLIIDKDERIVNISRNFLDALNLQGSRTVGSYVRDSLPELSPVLQACLDWHDKELEIKIEGLSIGGLPAWALATTIPSRETRLLGIAVKSGHFHEEGQRVVGGVSDIEPLAGTSEAHCSMCTRMGKLAQRDDPVLILGRGGTGKSTVARIMHENSPRKHGPFLSIDCALLTDENTEHFLFGTDTHPGLFERAAGGTLLFDGIESLPRKTQVILGSLLDQDSIFLPRHLPVERGSVRLLLTAKRNVLDLAGEDMLSREFCFRLPAAVLRIPSLQERPEDIPFIARQLMQPHLPPVSDQTDRIPAIADLEYLKDYSWPGEIRELKKAIDRAFLEAELDGKDIVSATRSICGSSNRTSDHLHAASAPHANRALDREDAPPLSYQAFERQELFDALARAHGNKSEAAKSLGITRKTLYARLRKHGLIN